MAFFLAVVVVLETEDEGARGAGLANKAEDKSVCFLTGVVDAVAGTDGNIPFN
jgi:hypothetical protein